MHLKNYEEKIYKFTIDNPSLDITNFLNGNIPKFSKEISFTYEKSQG